MKCQKCGSEIGYSLSCPYCGAQYGSGQNPTNPVTVQREGAQTNPISPRTERRQERRLMNLETLGLLSVILLTGIFVLELLQLLAALL